MVTRRITVMMVPLGMAALLVALVLAHFALQNVQASPGTLYVAPGGNCGAASPCYSTVQAAVDAAQSGDEIRVAAGTYTGINNQGGLAQMVYVDKSLTIRGGFTPSNWNTPDPDINVTELNAMTLGRVVYITGVDTIVTLEGLRFTYGDSTGLGGTKSGSDAGGGVYIMGASVTLNHCWIGHSASPSDGYGGGLYFRDGALQMLATILEENEAGHGGAAYFSEGQYVFVATSEFRNNRASTMNGEGAGISAFTDIFTFTHSTVEGNLATDGAPIAGALNIRSDHFLVEGSVISASQKTNGLSIGGTGIVRNTVIQANEVSGLKIGDGNYEVSQNEILHNGFGNYAEAGIYISGGYSLTATLTENYIHHNQNIYSSSYGGGVYVDTAPYGWVTLNGNIIQDNIAGEQAGLPSHGYGGGLYLTGDNITLERNLIQNNIAIGFIWAGSQYWGGYGGAMYINDDPKLINNIIAGNRILAPDSTHFHAPGIYVRGGSPELIYNTIAQNTGGDGVGLYVTQDSERSQVQMFNTIVVSQTIGIYAPGEEAENIVIADGILWSGNVSDTQGTGTFFLSHETTGDPDFVDPAYGDYHIGTASAAIDNGVTTSVTSDIDREPRFGTPDLGADEYWAPGTWKKLFLPTLTGSR